MNRTILLTRILAALVVLAVLGQWELIPMLRRNPLTLLGLAISAHLALSLTSLAGLLLRRAWGFYALYAAIVYGTIMLSIAFVPLPVSFLPPGRGWVGLTVLNAAVLALAVVGHRSLRKDRRGRLHAAGVSV